MLNEALNIIESNKPVSRLAEQRERQRKKQIIAGRKNIKGWQFKTGDFKEQDEVEESITSFLQSEDKKRKLQKTQEIKRKQLESGRRRAVDQWEEKADVAAPPPGIIGGTGAGKKREERDAPTSMEYFRAKPKPVPPYIQKEIAQQRSLPAKKSTLLKGLRSMDIPIPEQGIRFSFKKLGGNPFMTISFRKHGTFSKLFYLFFLVAVFAGLLRIRKWHFPAERITLFFKGKNLSDTYERFMQSRLVKIIPTLMMIVSIFLGLPWLLMGLGLNTVLLLRYLSIKRYEKIDYIPSFNYRIFLKYSLSYLILASSLLLIVTLFHPVFFISLAVSTILNCAFVALYAVLNFFTKSKEQLPPPSNTNDFPLTS